MKKAEAKLEPALAPLRDQVLFMKHNLNARAIAGLSGEVVSVQTNVDNLVREMESAIARLTRLSHHCSLNEPLATSKSERKGVAAKCRNPLIFLARPRLFAFSLPVCMRFIYGSSKILQVR